MEDRSVLTRLATEPDEVVAYGDHELQVADVWTPVADDTRPVVVYIHGGWWRPETDRMHSRPLSEDLRDRGWHVISLEYRRNPGQPDETVSDVREGIEYVVKRFPGRSIVTIGHSAGGHLALHAAAAKPIDRLTATIGLAPAADLAMVYEMNMGNGAAAAFLGVPADQRKDLDPVALDAPPTSVVLIHGSSDDVADIALSQSYVRHHSSARLVTVDGGHFSVIDPRQSDWRIVVEELESIAG